MTQNAVEIHHLSKIYKLYASPSDRLKETFHLLRKKYHQDFYALDNVSFDVKKGSTVGIIGQNGAGKSTLLKILTGVLTPSSGQYKIHGKVSSLLELGAGFNPDLTGLENIYFNGVMFGFSRKEIEARLDDILAFADIGAFIHQKVRTYSSGMFVRLAFAVAVQVDPDILIVDEALSVGDMRFQQKCFRRMKAFRESGKTVIFVTHDQGTVTNFCDYVYWFKEGKIVAHGEPVEVVKKYISYMAYGLDTKDLPHDPPENPHDPPENQDTSFLSAPAIETAAPLETGKKIDWEGVTTCASFGEGGASITGVAFVYADSLEKVIQVKGGEPVVFYMRLTVNRPIANMGIGINVNDHLGNTVFAIPSYVYKYVFPELEAGRTLVCEIYFEFPRIKNGRYSLSAAVAEGSQTCHVQHHWVHDTCFVDVVNSDLKHSLGTVVIPESRFEASFEKTANAQALNDIASTDFPHKGTEAG